MARAKIQAVRGKAVKGKPKKPEHPKEEVWKKFPPAIQNVHWKTVDNQGVRLSHGKGFLCLIMDQPGICCNFAKKKSFLAHFRTYHHLNPEEIKRGRPSKPGSSVRILSSDAKQKQEERLKGNWPGKVWRAKKSRLGTILKWAISMQEGCPEDHDKNQWIWDLAVKAYKTWRTGGEFTDSITDIGKRTREYWKSINPDLSSKDIRKKANMIRLKKMPNYDSEDGMPKLDQERSNLERGIFRLLPRTANVEDDTSGEEGSKHDDQDEQSGDESDHEEEKPTQKKRKRKRSEEEAEDDKDAPGHNRQKRALKAGAAKDVAAKEAAEAQKAALAKEAAAALKAAGKAAMKAAMSEEQAEQEKAAHKETRRAAKLQRIAVEDKAFAIKMAKKKAEEDEKVKEAARLHAKEQPRKMPEEEPEKETEEEPERDGEADDEQEEPEKETEEEPERDGEANDEEEKTKTTDAEASYKKSAAGKVSKRALSQKRMPKVVYNPRSAKKALAQKLVPLVDITLRPAHTKSSPAERQKPKVEPKPRPEATRKSARIAGTRSESDRHDIDKKAVPHSHDSEKAPAEHERAQQNETLKAFQDELEAQKAAEVAATEKAREKVAPEKAAEVAATKNAMEKVAAMKGTKSMTTDKVPEIFGKKVVVKVEKIAEKDAEKVATKVEKVAEKAEPEKCAHDKEKESREVPAHTLKHALDQCNVAEDLWRAEQAKLQNEAATEKLVKDQIAEQVRQAEMQRATELTRQLARDLKLFNKEQDINGHESKGNASGATVEGGAIGGSEDELYNVLQGYTEDHWDNFLDTCLAEKVLADQPVVPILLNPCVGGNYYEYVRTYDRVGTHGTVLRMPIDPVRRPHLSQFDIHFWVYLCRKCVVPLSPPHPMVNWPKNCYVWIGPDGRAIRKGKAEKQLINARASLHRLMSIKDKHSVNKIEIRILGKGWPEFPIVGIDPIPPYVEARSAEQVKAQQSSISTMYD